MAFKTVASSSKTILDITDAYSVLLTNDSYSVVCDKDGNAVAGELGSSGKAKTTIAVYKGNSSLTGVASNPGLNQFSYSITTQTGCTAARTDNSTFYINTVSADSGSVTVTVNVENETSFTKIFTFGKSKTGADGIRAKLVSLTGSGQTFLKNTSGVISPATITVTAEVQNTAVTDWTYSVDGAAFSATVPTGVSRTGSTVTITGSTMTAKSIVVKASDGTYSDVYTVSKIEDGGNALSPVISNSSHTVPASSGGTVSSYSGSGTTIQVFEGATPLTYHTTIANGRFTIGTPTINPASKITVGAISGSGTTTATVAAHSAMDGVTDSVVITYPITARRADGTQTTFNVSQTITKSKTGNSGNDGQDGYTVILTNESHTFVGSIDAAIAGSAVSNVIVYKGATQIPTTITSITGLVDGLTAPITGNGTTSNYFTATATTALVARNGELTVNISADGKTFVKKFTFTVTRDGINGTNGGPGNPGEPARLVDIIPSALYFVTNTIGTDPSTYVYAPATIALTPTFQSCSYSKWEYSVNGSTWTTITTQNGLSINSTSKVLTVSSTSTLFSTTQTFLIFKCSSTTGEADVVTLNRIFESTSLAGRMASAEVNITPQAITSTVRQSTDYINDLGQKVSSNEIISKINQTAEAISISADKINFTGAKITFNMLDSTLQDDLDGMVGSAKVQYYHSTSSSSLAGGTWQDTAPTWAEDKYVWSRTKITYHGGSVAYEPSETGTNISGARGADGTIYYTWVKYADTATGSGMSDSPTGKRFLGLAHNKTTATESNTPGDYTWSPLYDNVVVGGRNLIQRYGEIQNSLIDSTGAIASAVDNSVMLETIPVTPGETLTFSKTTTSSDNYFRWKWMNASGVYIARTENNSNEFQWVVPANAASIQVSYPLNSFPQVERGNIATGWGLAPEDIERALGDKATSTEIDAVNNLIDELIGDVSGKADAGELETLRQAYNAKVAQDLVDKAIAEGDLGTLKGRTLAIETNLGAKAEQWNFIETSITMADEGIFIGNNVTQMGVLVGTDRISFMDKGTEVAYISNKTMEISHGIFVESAIIGKHKIETIPSTDITIFTFVG